MRTGKLCLLSLLICLFFFIEQATKGEETGKNKESSFYTIFSGNIGAGLGKLYISEEGNDSDDSSNNDWWSDWDDRVYGFSGSIRICRLSFGSRVVKESKEEGFLRGQGIGGFGVDISAIEFNHKAKLGEEETGLLSLDLARWKTYWELAETDLFYEFGSTAFMATPGVQVIDFKTRLSLFIGAIGIGYARNRFTHHFWDTLLEMSKAEGEEVDFRMETAVAPVVFSILPIKLDWLFYRNMAIGLNFSGLLCYPGKTGLAVLLEEPSDEIKWIEPTTNTSWLHNFQLGLTASFYLR